MCFILLTFPLLVLVLAFMNTDVYSRTDNQHINLLAEQLHLIFPELWYSVTEQLALLSLA